MMGAFSISAHSRRMLLMLSLVVMLAPLASAAPTPSNTPDPRVLTIRRALESVGLKVVSVEFGVVSGTPVWLVATESTYRRPSWKVVIDQSFVMWSVMFGVLEKGTLPETFLTTAQDWTGYRLFLSARLREYAAWAGAAKKSEKEKQKASEAFAKAYSLTFRVFDLKQQRFLDPLAFVKEHFVSE